MNSLTRFCKYIKNNAKFDAEEVKQILDTIIASGENTPAALARILIHD